MSDQYLITPGKIKATGIDLETWIRHCLEQHRLQYGFRVQREDLDQTKKRFRLNFLGKFFSPHYPPAESIWGAAELIEWSDDATEILRIWIYAPPKDDIKFYRDKKTIDEILQDRMNWLTELAEEVLDKFEKMDRTEGGLAPYQAAMPAQPEKPKKPDPGSHIDMWFDWYHAMLENRFKCTLKEIADATTHSPGYIRQLHAQYVHERGLEKPNIKTNRKTNKN